MKRTTTTLLALGIGMLLANASTARAASWGHLKGKFVFDGDLPEAIKLNISKDPEVCGKHDLVDEALVVGAEGGLANVLVYVRTKKVDVHPDYAASDKETLRLDNKNCRFEPHILTIRLTQTLELHNSDPMIGHNSNLQPLGDQGINPNIPSGQSAEFKFGRAQNLPVPVVCNIHPWMKGWVLPRDNPYMAVSAEDGSFEIKNLPAGKLEFQVWQEKAGYLEAKKDWKKGRFEMTIAEGDNDLGEITVDPKLFDK